MTQMNIKWISTTEENPWEQIRSVEIFSESNAAGILEVTGESNQIIDGFGGCFNELGWVALSKLEDDKRNKILDELFLESGCNFNFCRMPMGANDYSLEWFSYNETDMDYEMKYFTIERDYHYLLPYIRAGMKRQPKMTLFASPWSPPTWMKFPKAHNYGTLIWTKENLTAYALYFLKFIEAYKREGIQIDQVHIQNEPMSSQKFPSCVWTGAQLGEFIRDYIGPLFEENGIKTEIWLGTLNGPETDGRKYHTDYDDYANLVLSDANARKYIKGVSYQWAGKHAIQRTYESWPEIKLMQSENECGNGENTWEYAHYVFRLLRHYLANGANSYIYWNMVLEPGGTSTWGWNQNSMITVGENNEIIYNPEFYVMKHFSHFIEKGAVRLSTKGNLTGNSLAFENPDGSIVLIINNGFKKERQVALKVKGKQYTVILKPYSFNTFVV